MKKIDLHQQIISSFDSDINKFAEKVTDTKSQNDGGYPNYQEADLQIVFASIWPYETLNESGGKAVQYSKKKILTQWQKYEQLRQKFNVKLLKNRYDVNSTTFFGYNLNFVYHIKGLDFLELKDIEKLKDAGFRSFQVVWHFDNQYAGSRHSPEKGLTEKGIDLIEYLEQNHLIIDTAGMSYKSMIETYQYTKNKPILCSHTNLYSLFQHGRNITDEVLEFIARSEGLIGLSLISHYMVPDFQQATLENFMLQIKYVVDKVGPDHVALGSGFHIPYYPRLLQEVETIDQLNILEQEVISRFGEKFASKFFRDNAYRFLIQNFE